MDYEQRIFAKLAFTAKLIDLYGNAFESFFSDLMSLRYPDFMDVRTHGNLGDMGADGLLLHSEKLYACYAPETFDTHAVKSKFESDLQKAIKKRRDEFKVFVFVHNDLRGIHPEVVSLISAASRDHAPLAFHQVGKRHLWNEISHLDKIEVETLLGPIPIESKIYGIGLADIEPLLSHLRSYAELAPMSRTLPSPPPYKMEYNRISGELRNLLIRCMPDTPAVEQYYALTIDPNERDEVAYGFATYYRTVHDRWEDPEDIYCEMKKYVIGNAMTTETKTHAANVILSYFFQYCDIFDVPPAGWTPEHQKEPAA